MALRFDRHAVGCGAADRGCTAHHHVAYRIRRLRRGLAGNVYEFEWQPPLIDEFQAAVAPAQGFYVHTQVVFR